MAGMDQQYQPHQRNQLLSAFPIQSLSKRRTTSRPICNRSELCKPSKATSFRRMRGYRRAKQSGLWCPDCAVMIYVPAAQGVAMREVLCRICGEEFDNPLFVE